MDFRDRKDFKPPCWQFFGATPIISVEERKWEPQPIFYWALENPTG